MINLPASLPQDEHTLLTLERGWHNDLDNFLQHGLPKILVALLIAFVLARVVSFFVRRMRRRADQLVGNSQRAAQLRTLAGILRATMYSVIGFYVFVQVLGALGAPLGSFVGAAGVIGLGISFGAQSIFKDMLNGLFILLEDQYSVGDTVKSRACKARWKALPCAAPSSATAMAHFTSYPTDRSRLCPTCLAIFP